MRLWPDGIVMNPTNWKTILLTKDTTGQYYGGGPFASPHAPTLLGLPVALASAIAAGSHAEPQQSNHRATRLLPFRPFGLL